MKFSDLGVSVDACNVLKKSGIVEPTRFQKETYKIVYSGKSALLCGPTGSGKSIGFLLPQLEKIKSKSNRPQMLILVPRRELAMQVASVAKELAEIKGLGVLSVFGGVDVFTQLRKLNNGVDIVVATPGRLLDLIRRDGIVLSGIRHFVIDEVDEMLLMGFMPDVIKVKKYTPKKLQCIGVSATVDEKVKKAFYSVCREYEFIDCSSRISSNKVINQEVVYTTDRKKKDMFFKVLDEDRPFMAIVFCRTKKRADDLFNDMEDAGYNCRCIHSDIPQPKRKKIIKEFSSGDIQFLIATDVASRGLDIDGVDYVYNYDCPESSEDYIHRIGRCGRTKDDGHAVTFVVDRHKIWFDNIKNQIKGIKIRNISDF